MCFLQLNLLTTRFEHLSYRLHARQTVSFLEVIYRVCWSNPRDVSMLSGYQMVPYLDFGAYTQMSAHTSQTYQIPQLPRTTRNQPDEHIGMTSEYCTRAWSSFKSLTRTRKVNPEDNTSMGPDKQWDFGHSQLGRLPAEIRNTIYAMVLTYRHGIRCDNSSWLPMDDGSSILQALSIMLTCKQVRKETKLLLFTLNDIVSSEGPITPRFTDRSVPIYNPISMDTISLLNSIPPTLLSPCSRLVTWIPPNIAMDTLALHLRVAQNIHYLQLHLGVILGHHSWCGCSDENGSDCQTDKFHNTPICSRDVSASMNDCARVKLVFPINDLRTALTLVNDQCQAKVTLVETHRSHRICPVRVGLDNLLVCHEQVHRNLTKLVNRVYGQM